MENRFCPQCGKELDTNARFCIYCGADRAAPEPAVNVPQPGPPVQYPPVYPVVKPPRKRWPVFVIAGVALVVIAAAVLLLTGVIKLGGGGATFAPTDLIGNWSGEMSLDAVNGSGSDAESMRQYIGDTQPIDMQLTLDQTGKGTAVIYSDSITAELQGSNLVLNGQTGTGETFSYTGSITKTGNGYSMAGNYSMAMSGVSIQGKITMQRSAVSATPTPIAMQTQYATPIPTLYPAYTPQAYTAEPTLINTATALEGTWQYMYDEENSYAACMEFYTDGTCIVYNTEDYERIPGTYIIEDNMLNLTLYPVGSETQYETYIISIGTGQFTLEDLSTGNRLTFIQVE